MHFHERNRFISSLATSQHSFYSQDLQQHESCYASPKSIAVAILTGFLGSGKIDDDDESEVYYAQYICT
jgi:hypothetical protein